ncbi:MAG: gamma-butyrobetaine hydroxylase-like domain-containing protein, partial [Terricaulis sp.]
EIPFELLRVESPSAENKGHGGNVPPPVTGKANVNVVSADAVGRYAVRISFDAATTPASIHGTCYTISAARKTRSSASIATRCACAH